MNTIPLGCVYDIRPTRPMYTQHNTFLETRKLDAIIIQWANTTYIVVPAFKLKQTHPITHTPLHARRTHLTIETHCTTQWHLTLKVFKMFKLYMFMQTTANSHDKTRLRTIKGILLVSVGKVIPWHGPANWQWLFFVAATVRVQMSKIKQTCAILNHMWAPSNVSWVAEGTRGSKLKKDRMRYITPENT